MRGEQFQKVQYDPPTIKHKRVKNRGNVLSLGKSMNVSSMRSKREYIVFNAGWISRLEETSVF